MKLDVRCESLVKKDCDILPDYLNQSDPSEVYALPLGNQYYSLSRALLVQHIITERFLHNVDDLLSFGVIRCGIPHVINHPLVEVFRLACHI